MSPNSAPEPLRSVIVGCGPMAGWHARTMAGLDEYALVGFCEIDQTLAEKLRDAIGGGRTYSDYPAMLTEEKPKVVVVVTPSNLHAEMTIQAAEAGARGVYCEKPMATCMADGWAMVDACRANDTALAVNHQRRMSPPILRMKELIEDGAIGDAYLYRGSCAGDLLSDATHLVDAIRFLAADAPARWVFGQIHREVGEEVPRRSGHVPLASQGFRYGHAVETGAFGVWEFETGVRAEVLCGDMRLPGREYGDYEILGTEGRLWRPGDVGDPPLLIEDSQSGNWRPVEGEGLGGREAHIATARACYHQFARTVREGADHPLSGDSALKDLEVIMGIYESARLRRKIELPLQQPRYPLDIMIEEGEA